MKLILIRHPQPLHADGKCYGQLDLPACPIAVNTDAERLAQQLPQGISVDVSELTRAQQLAQALAKRRPDLCWTTTPLLNEMNFGTWEGVSWTHIPKKDLDAWILDFMFYRPGGAECLNDVFLRVHSMLKNTFDKNQKQAAWLTHAGVIKTVLWWTTNRHTPPKAHEWPKNSLGFGQWLEITKKDLLYSRV